MKTTIILLISLLSFIGNVKADEDRPIRVDELPQSSREFIRKYFPQSEVSFAKVEKDLWEKKYEVVFVNGEKIEFDKQGKWEEVKCKYSSVPVNIIPEAIRNHIQHQYPDTKVLKIERDSRGYEVELSNRLELKYNTSYQLVDIDD